MVLLALGGDEAEASLLVDWLESAELRADALWALGFSGRVAAMEGCVKYLEVPEVAQLAGEALSTMTSLRLEGAYALHPGERPEGAPVPPEEQESLDADLVTRPEDDLPWPHVAAVRDWWTQARTRFAKGTRYLLGQPFSGPVLLEALESSPMRRRHVLARELAIRTRGQHVIPTRAFTRHQRDAVARARGACTSRAKDWGTRGPERAPLCWAWPCIGRAGVSPAHAGLSSMAVLTVGALVPASWR